MSQLSQRLSSIRKTANLAGLSTMTRGLEKESLRVSREGTLANTPHANALGSALTHPQITTDYSEALLEFITPPNTSIEQLTTTLDNLHRFTYQHIGDESLWVNSMPCMLGTNSEIPIARYGSSNSGRMKSVYRLGLGHRYGRAMQTIAGIHFNFSVSDDLWQFLLEEDKSHLSLRDYKTQGYFKLIRNFRRYYWLLLYLFGAAPAVCRTFVQHREHQLEPFGKDTHSLHAPYGTSLRMGDLGYQSSAQESLVITYNCLESYTNTLCRAITQTHSDYTNIGILDKQGEHQQLNDCLLQIENEFYSVIRPKRTARSGQTALNALEEGGVEYIEVRCLDLNPYEPVGINQDQIRFLDLFLLYCLLADSPESNPQEYHQQQENQKRMVYNGRNPTLSLYDNGRERNAREWGHALLKSFSPIADLLDQHNNSKHYSDALAIEARKLDDDSLTPSSRVLKDMENQGITFYRFAMNAALSTRDQFRKRPLCPDIIADYEKVALKSLEDQQHIEETDQISFDQFLKHYYEQYHCKVEPCPEKEAMNTSIDTVSMINAG